MNAMRRIALQGALGPALMVLGAVLTFWALLPLKSTLGTREQAFMRAEQAIDRVAAPSMTPHGIQRRLIGEIDTLLGRRALRLNYVTLQNTDGATLISRGRFSNSLSWLPVTSARYWRGWWYRLRSAETRRPIFSGGQQIGSCVFGIDWIALLAASIASWQRLLVALSSGLACFVFGLILIARTAGRHTLRLDWSMLSRRWSKRVGPRRPTANNAAAEFALIGPAVGSYEAFEIARPRAAMPSGPPAGADETSAEGNDPPIERPARPQEIVREHGPAKQAARTDTPPAATPDRRAARNDAANETGRRPKTRKRSDIFSSDPLELRFFPIWQGADENAVLVGGWATATGSADGNENKPQWHAGLGTSRLRTLSQWLGERLSILQANWRALEFATVPIVMALPGAHAADPEAEAVCRAALRQRRGGQRRDIVFCAAPNGSVLETTPDSCAAQTTDAAEQAQPIHLAPAEHERATVGAWIKRLDRPLLLGPLTDPQTWQAELAQPNVFWFADAAAGHSGYSARGFARLINSVCALGTL